MTEAHPRLRRYAWYGHDRNGRQVGGATRAASRHGMRAMLRESGIEPAWIARRTALPALSAAAFSARLARALATLLGAGIPLREALVATVALQPDRRHAEQVDQLRIALETGQSFAAALQAQSLPGLDGELIAIAEQSGTLPPTLARIADAQTRSAALRSTLQGALAYPVVVIGCATVVTLVLLQTVLPTLAALYAEAGAALPAPTRWLLGASEQLARHRWLAVGIGAGAVAMAVRRRDHWRRWRLRLPLVGPVWRWRAQSAWCMAVAILLQAGVPLSEAIWPAARATGEVVYLDAAPGIDHLLQTGATLTLAAEESGLFEPLLEQMVAIGEQSGELTTMLNHCAALSAQEAERSAQQLATFAGPLATAFAGALIAALVATVYLPIFRLGEALG